MFKKLSFIYTNVLLFLFLLTPLIVEATINNSSSADNSTRLIPYPVDNKIDSRVPLILIHGIHGNETGESFGIKVDDVNNPNWIYWANFTDYFFNNELNKSYKLYGFFYESDKYPVSEIAKSLRNHIDNAIGESLISDKPLIIIAHSMGGLIARSYMNEYIHNSGKFKGKKAGERILRLITLGTPHHGTPAANDSPRTFFFGDQAILTLVVNLIDIFYWFKFDNDCQDAILKACTSSNLLNSFTNLFSISQKCQIQVDEENRSDLRYDNYYKISDDYEKSKEKNKWLIYLNESDKYLDNIMAFYGSIDTNDPFYKYLKNLTAYELLVVFSNAYIHNKIPKEYNPYNYDLPFDKHNQLIFASVILSECYLLCNDGMVPIDSGQYNRENIYKKIYLHDYDHLEMKDDKQNEMKIFKSIETELNYIINTVLTDGGYSFPPEYSTIRSVVPLKGWADSPVGVDYVKFTAFYDGTWHEIYTDSAEPYEYNWDLSDISEQEIVLGFDIYAKNGAVSQSPSGTVKIYHSKTVDDFSPPSIPSSPQDQGSETDSTNLTFTWNSSTDSQSGIKGYKLTLNSYANWQDASSDHYGAKIYENFVGKVQSYTFNVGTPHVGRVIKAAVKSIDKAGNESEWSSLSDGIEITGSSKIPPPENSPVRTSGKDKVYLFKDGRKWWIINQDIFQRLGLQESEIIDYQPGILDNYPIGPNIVADGSLIRKIKTDEVYLIDNGKRKHLTYDAFLHGNYEWENVFDVFEDSWSSLIEIFPEGEEIDWDTIPPSVSLIAPSGGENWLSGDQKIIRWSATDDARIDYVDLYYTSDGWSTSKVIENGLQNDGQYLWTVPDTNTPDAAIRIESFDIYGNSKSDYSDNFAIYNTGIEPPVTPILYDPGKIIASNQINLRWRKVVDSNYEDNVDYYEIEFADNPGFDSSNFINAGDPSTGNNIYETLSYIVTGLEDDKTYYFRIRAINEEGISNWSGYQSIHVDIQDLPYFDQTFQEPVDGAKNISKRPILRWEALDPDGDNLDYYVAIGTDTNEVDRTLRGFLSDRQGQNWFNFSEEYPISLKPNTTYYWQIWVREEGHSIDYYGEYIKSPVWHFTTEASGSDLAITNINHLGDIEPNSEITFKVTVKNYGSEKAKPRTIQAAYIKNNKESLFFHGRGYMDQELPPEGEEIIDMKLNFQETVFEHNGVTYDNVLVSGDSQARFYFLNEDDQDINKENNTQNYNIYYEDAGGPALQYFDVREYGSMYEEWSKGIFWARTGENLSIIFEAVDDVMIEKIMAQYRYHANDTWTTFHVEFPNRPYFSTSLNWEIPLNIQLTDDAQVRILIYDDNENETIKNSELFSIYSSRLEATIEPTNLFFPVGSELTYNIMVDSDNEIEKIEVDLSGAGTIYHEENENGIVIADQYSWHIPNDNYYSSKNCYLELIVEDIRGNIRNHRSDRFRLDPNTELPPPFNEAIKLYEDEIDFPVDALYEEQDINTLFVQLDNKNIAHIILEHKYNYYLETAEGNFEDTYVSVDDKYYITFDSKTKTASSKIKICDKKYKIEDFKLFQANPYVLLSSSDKREQYFYTYKRDQSFVEPKIIANQEIPSVSSAQKKQEIYESNPFDDNTNTALLNGYIWELDLFTDFISRYPFSGGSIGQEERIAIANGAGNVESFWIDPTTDGDLIFFIDPWESKLVKFNTISLSASSYDLPFSVYQEERNREKKTSLVANNGNVYIFSQGKVYSLENDNIIENGNISYSFNGELVDYFSEWDEIFFNHSLKIGETIYLILGVSYTSLTKPIRTKYEILKFDETTQTLSKIIAQTKPNQTLHKSCDIEPIDEQKVLFVFSEDKAISSYLHHYITELKILDLKSGDIFPVGKLPFKTEGHVLLINEEGNLYAVAENKENYTSELYHISINNLTNCPQQIKEIQFLKFNDELFASWGYGHPYDGTWNTEKGQVNNRVLAKNILFEIFPNFGNRSDLSNQYIGYGFNVVGDYLSSTDDKIYSLNPDHTINNEIFEIDWSSLMEFNSYDSKYIGALSKYTNGNCQVTLLKNDLTTTSFNGTTKYIDVASFNDEIIQIGYCDEYEKTCYGKHVITKFNLSKNIFNEICFGSHFDSYKNFQKVDINENKSVAVGWNNFLAVANLSRDIAAPQIKFLNTSDHVLKNSTLSLLWDASDNQNKLDKYELYKIINNESILLNTFNDTTITHYDYLVTDLNVDQIRFKMKVYDYAGNSAYDTIQFDIVDPVQLTSFSVNKSSVQLGENLLFSWEAQNSNSSTMFTLYKKKSSENQWVEFLQIVGSKSTSISIEDFVGDYQFKLQAENDSILLPNTVTIQGEIPSFDNTGFTPSTRAYYVPNQEFQLNWSLENALNNEASYEVYIKTDNEEGFHKVSETTDSSTTIHLTAQNIQSFEWKVSINYEGRIYESDTFEVKLQQIPSPTINSLTLINNHTNNPSAYLQFETFQDIETYLILRKTEGGHWKELALVQEGNYTDDTITYGQNYEYAVCSKSQRLQGKPGATQSIFVDTKNINLINIQNNNYSIIEGEQITLQINPVPDNSYEKYEIWIGLNKSSMSFHSITSKRSITIENLEFNTTYYIDIYPLDYKNEKTTNTPATLTFTTLPCPIPNAPSYLSAQRVSASAMLLSWADNSENEIGFKVERKLKGDGHWRQFYVVSAETTTFADQNLPTEQPYLYRIRAYNDSGNSDYSNTAEEEPQDSDQDNLPDSLEETMCTDPNDADTDDDGIIDGTEDANHNGQVDTGETDPCDIDTDNDGIQDGTEIGLTEADVGQDTDLNVFKPDLDPTTTTDPLDEDSDDDGVLDGEEDANGNGRVDNGETDPEEIDCSLDDDSAGLQTLFEADFEENELNAFPAQPSPGPGTCLKLFEQQALVKGSLGDHASKLLVLEDTNDSTDNLAVYCELDRAVRGPVVLEWDAVVVSKTRDDQDRVYATDGLGSDPGSGSPVLFEIPLIGNNYQDNGNAYALPLNQSHHFKAVLDTKKQQYCVWIDNEVLAVNVSFDDSEAEDFFTLGFGSFKGSEVVAGFDNILIKGLAGYCLPGINLLLMD